PKPLNILLNLTALWIVMLEVSFVNEFTANIDFYVSHFVGYFNLLATQLSILLAYISILFFVNASLLNSTAYMAITLSIFFRFNRVNSILHRTPRQFDFFHFYRFAFFHTKTLSLILVFNRVCSKIMLVLVAVLTPMNAY